MKYQVLFLDHGGKVFSRAELQADDDRAAIDLADRVHRTGIGSGYAIQRNGVTIHLEEFGPVASIKNTPRPARQAQA